MDLASLAHRMKSQRDQRVRRAQNRILDLRIAHHAYLTHALRHHLDRTVQRSLQRHPDGSDLDRVVRETEGFLMAHRRRVEGAHHLVQKDRQP